MRKLVKVAIAPVTVAASTAVAYAGGGGSDVGDVSVIIRAISHILTQLSSMF